VVNKDYSVKEFYKGETIFRQGSVGQKAYILKKGKVQVSVIGRDGEDTVVAVIEPVHVFGEMALLLDDTRTATIKAVEFAEVIEVNRETFSQTLNGSPEIVVNILNAMAERLKLTTEKVIELPDLISGICEILGLVSEHNEDILYNSTVKTLIRLFGIEEKQVDEELKKLENFRFLELKINAEEQKVIKLLPKEFSLNKVMDMYRVTQRKD
jgi:CRP-like cAMP-binding protein